MSVEFDYKQRDSLKVSNDFSEEFKNKYVVNIKGTPAIKVDGLIGIAHIKGIWKFDVSIIQYPNEANNNTAICKCTIGGYDWDPIQEEIIRVEYSDIADASPSNCNKMVAGAFIRMASTRAQGRVLRRYTNVDLVCSDEIYEDSHDYEKKEPLVDIKILESIKQTVKEKRISKEVLESMLNTFNKNKFESLTETEGNTLLRLVQEYVTPSN